MPDKLTDSEIVKVFDCCYADKPCEQCPCYIDYKCILPNDSATLIPQKIVDLINHLQAEKEELVGNIDKLKAELFDKAEQLKTAKTEAYEEFAEWLRAKSWETDTVLGFVKVIAREEISRFLKEKGCESREIFIRSLSKTVKKEINRRADSGTEET